MVTGKSSPAGAGVAFKQNERNHPMLRKTLPHPL